MHAHRRRGPIDGTGTSSGSAFTSTTLWRLHPRARHHASSEWIRLGRMLPSVIGGPV